MKKKIEFGLKAKDLITGFEGVITGKCDYISGCSQVLISPPVKDGDWKESKWFDEQRLIIIDGDQIVLDNGLTPGCDIEAPVK